MITKNARFKCDYCGRFIAMSEEIVPVKDEHLTMDGVYWSEEWEYHKKCFDKMLSAGKDKK